MAGEIVGELDTAGLEAELRGELIRPGDEAYEDGRKVYNAMIDKRPALIARCRDVADVIAAVNFARGSGLDTAIRGGGHNGAGLGTVDGGLVIDLSPMRGVRVDPDAGVVHVEGGCTWGDVDHATHVFGMATPGGIISTTGVGLALGGGIGHLTRRCGLTIDNFVSADVVLADGSFVRASEGEHEDLFWALRGGGGNFGVITSLTLRLHPIHTVIAGPMFWPLEQAEDAMRFYRDFIADAPDDLSGFFLFLTVPPVPPFPEHLHMEKVCGVLWYWTGPHEKADEVFAPMRAFGPPILDGVGPVPHPIMQSAFDGLYPPGDQWYWRADFVRELSDAAIAAHAEHGSKLPTWKSTMHLYPVDGQAARVGNDETAWAYRDAKWAQVIVGVDPDPANAGLLRQWTVDYFESLHPHSMGGAYVNFMMEEGQERVRATYRDNYARLVEIKNRYDAGNLFHVNQNIRPASSP